MITGNAPGQLDESGSSIMDDGVNWWELNFESVCKELGEVGASCGKFDTCWSGADEGRKLVYTFLGGRGRGDERLAWDDECEIDVLGIFDQEGGTVECGNDNDFIWLRGSCGGLGGGDEDVVGFIVRGCGIGGRVDLEAFCSWTRRVNEKVPLRRGVIGGGSLARHVMSSCSGWRRKYIDSFEPISLSVLLSLEEWKPLESEVLLYLSVLVWPCNGSLLLLKNNAKV